MEKEINNSSDQKRSGSKKGNRELIGTVVSAKMLKTVVVVVNRLKMQKKYRKQYLLSRRYKAHDEKGEYKPGDKVVIRETKPLSKDKRWIVAGKV